jgi:hypothetical protein
LDFAIEQRVRKTGSVRACVWTVNGKTHFRIAQTR